LTALISHLLARRLNRLASFHIKQMAYGNDDGAITADRSGAEAFAGEGCSTVLPVQIARQLSENADTAAAAAIPDLRRKIASLMADASKGKAADISDYLTWNELIHTVYFRVPEFRKLMCFAISEAPGFTATDQLKSDAQLSEIKGWYREISQPSASDGKMSSTNS
ncbi:MAG: hypothetical protein ACR2PG_14550, partial [Hyphomicrobiaceae bacterium]